MNILDFGIKYCTKLSFLPCELSDKTPAKAAGKWKKYQSHKPGPEQIKKWFKDTDNAIAIIAGAVSGNLEIIDIDNHFGDAVDLFNNLNELVSNHIPGLWEKLVIETTQSGGYHLFYRCTALEGNSKLAMRKHESEDKVEAIIETRGEGGYALVAPSPGYNLIQNDFGKIPILKPETRAMLLEICRSFNEFTKDAELPDENYKHNTLSERPGDAFNRNGEITSYLQAHGWKLLSNGKKQQWKRPGKDSKGISATFNFVPEKFYVFSSNAYPFEYGKAYDKFAVYSILEHGGSFSEAAAGLLKLGYGTKNGQPSNVATKTKKPATTTTKSKAENNGNFIDAIESFFAEHYDFRYNLVKAFVEFKEKGDDEWEQITDRHVSEIWRELKKLNFEKISLPNIETILKSKFVKDFHPFKNYFNNLPVWDGHNRVKEFIETIVVDDRDKVLWSKYFTKWIVGVVACALERGLNHSCIVFVGAQGIGKTTIIGKLIPDQLKPYYAIAQINPADKDSKILISESFIINLDELESSTRDEIGHLKSLMTIDQVTVRKPYGHHAETSKRRASFIGSVNKSLFLTDMTGTRRFLAVDVKSIDLNVKFDIDQLYAQALDMLNQGVQYWFSGDEIEMINNHNKKFQVNCPEEDLLLRQFKPYDCEEFTLDALKAQENNGLFKFMTSTEILNELQKNTNLRLSHVKLGQFLKNLGFKQRWLKQNGKALRVYPVMKENNNEVQDEMPF
jgi:predicted P-loop ATPase